MKYKKTIYAGFSSATRTPWFHSYEYRHILRFPDNMSEYKGHKKTQTKWFCRKYTELKKTFLENNLDPGGFSKAHTIIIAKVFKINETKLLKDYHGGNQ